MLRALVEFYVERPAAMPSPSAFEVAPGDPVRAAVAYVAGMTDRYAFDRAVTELVNVFAHQDDDGFVPSSASHALAQARPDLVELQTFSTARHTKLWNYDQERWTDAIGDWVRRQGLAAEGVAS